MNERIERLKEEIKFRTEIYRLIWLTVLGGGGGLISLTLGTTSPLKVALIASGGVSLVVLLVIAQHLYREIRQLISHIEGGRQ